MLGLVPATMKRYDDQRISGIERHHLMVTDRATTGQTRLEDAPG
jgi:hypothetical protein